ncbi:hypothetical protein Ancab_025792 [Ancistrocladus abbreviatus]
MREIVGDRLPKFKKEERLMVQGSIDFVGINQYTTYYISNPPPQEKPKPLSYQQDWHAEFACKIFSPFNPDSVDSTSMDYAGNQTFFDAIDDTKRIAYYRGYMAELKRATNDGANVIGYFAWSLLDNFEWRLGYTSRFGIVYVNYKTLERYPKMSAYWFKQLLDRGYK